MSKLKSAIEHMMFFHKDQVRKDTGLPYHTHPIAVMHILMTLFNIKDEDMLIATLFHDIIEDCGISPYWIKKEYGVRVARLVVELTNRFTKDKYPSLNRAARQQKEHDRLSRMSYEAKLIKLADRLHNVQELLLYSNDKKWRAKYLSESDSLFIALNIPQSLPINYCINYEK